MHSTLLNHYLKIWEICFGDGRRPASDEGSFQEEVWNGTRVGMYHTVGLSVKGSIDHSDKFEDSSEAGKASSRLELAGVLDVLEPVHDFARQDSVALVHTRSEWIRILAIESVKCKQTLKMFLR